MNPRSSNNFLIYFGTTDKSLADVKMHKEDLFGPDESLPQSGDGKYKVTAVLMIRTIKLDTCCQRPSWSWKGATRGSRPMVCTPIPPARLARACPVHHRFVEGIFCPRIDSTQVVLRLEVGVGAWRTQRMVPMVETVLWSACGVAHTGAPEQSSAKQHHTLIWRKQTGPQHTGGQAAQLSHVLKKMVSISSGGWMEKPAQIRRGSSIKDIQFNPT